MNTPTDSQLMATTSALMVLSRAYRGAADKALADYGLSQATAWPVILAGRLGDGVRQGALAEALGVEGPSLVRLLDKLCSGGLVRRECDVNDRRANLLWLTDRGQTTFVELEQALNALRAQLLGELSVQDIEGVLKFYRVLAEASTRLP